jgi:hypothetical protein
MQNRAIISSHYHRIVAHVGDQASNNDRNYNNIVNCYSCLRDMLGEIIWLTDSLLLAYRKAHIAYYLNWLINYYCGIFSNGILSDIYATSMKEHAVC